MKTFLIIVLVVAGLAGTAYAADCCYNAICCGLPCCAGK